MKSVAVYLGSKIGNDTIFGNSASTLGRMLAENNITIIYGGANVGTMKALADGALEVNGEVIGIFPKGFKGKKEIREAGIDVLHHHLSRMIYVKDLQERKALMNSMSDGCIILPGSFGTIDELMEYTLSKQLGLHIKPVFVLNILDYYTPLRQLIHNMVRYGFIPPEEEALISFCSSVDEVVAAVKKSVD